MSCQIECLSNLLDGDVKILIEKHCETTWNCSNQEKTAKSNADGLKHRAGMNAKSWFLDFRDHDSEMKQRLKKVKTNSALGRIGCSATWECGTVVARLKTAKPVSNLAARWRFGLSVVASQQNILGGVSLSVLSHALPVSVWLSCRCSGLYPVGALDQMHR